MAHVPYPEGVPRQTQPEMEGKEHKMEPRPMYEADWYKGSGKLQDKVAIITGGDSGIGRAVAILYAREGANVAINYLKSDSDAKETKEAVEHEGRKCLLVKGDVSQKEVCEEIVKKTVKEFGKLDILVNNAAIQYVRESITEISQEQLQETFSVNIFHMFYMVQAALEHLKKTKGCIINNSSITQFKGQPILLDYSATKGAITAFTRSLSQQLVDDGIRVNQVAPGPIWTPLIPASFPAEKVGKFGKDTPMGRPGQPEEVSPAFVFLAARDSSYMTGQTLHVNGGTVVNA
jgi:NAD(P)-dependent dehydrogenase (short-subunit alcohol dehydrogenase family)